MSLQVCWQHVEKSVRVENPIYRRSLGVIFKTPRGRSGKPRVLSKEEYYAKHENSHSARDFQNPRTHGGD
jgi:hypothetical protein